MTAKAKKQAKQHSNDPIQKLEKRISDLKAKLAGMKDASRDDPKHRKAKKRLRRSQRRRRRMISFNQRIEERHKSKKPAETPSAPAAPAAEPAPPAASAEPASPAS